MLYKIEIDVSYIKKKNALKKSWNYTGSLLVITSGWGDCIWFLVYAFVYFYRFSVMRMWALTLLKKAKKNQNQSMNHLLYISCCSLSMWLEARGHLQILAKIYEEPHLNWKINSVYKRGGNSQLLRSRFILGKLKIMIGKYLYWATRYTQWNYLSYLNRWLGFSCTQLQT